MYELKEFAGIAQLVEQLIRNQQVACSSHVSSSKESRRVRNPTAFCYVRTNFLKNYTGRLQRGQEVCCSLWGRKCTENGPKDLLAEAAELLQGAIFAGKRMADKNQPMDCFLGDTFA